MAVAGCADPRYPRTGSLNGLGSPFFPESQRERAAASPEAACFPVDVLPVPGSPALSASPNLPRASPIHLEQWKAVSHGLAGILQDATPGSCSSSGQLVSPGPGLSLSFTVAGPQSPTSARPWNPKTAASPASPVSPVSPASLWSTSPIVVEQWQTVGQRLASVFQDHGLWATTPTASSPDWHRLLLTVQNLAVRPL